MNASPPHESSKLNDIAHAKREVARAERALGDGMHEVSLVGRAGAERALAVVKPVLVTAAVVGGIVWLTSALRRPRPTAFERASTPEGSSILREAVRTLALSLASVAARRIAEALLSSAKGDHPIPAWQTASPHEVSQR